MNDAFMFNFFNLFYQEILFRQLDYTQITISRSGAVSLYISGHNCPGQEVVTFLATCPVSKDAAQYQPDLNQLQWEMSSIPGYDWSALFIFFELTNHKGVDPLISLFSKFIFDCDLLSVSADWQVSSLYLCINTEIGMEWYNNIPQKQR